MTDIKDIKALLPDPDPDAESYEKLKKEHPRTILRTYAKAIDEKYDGKLSVEVLELHSGSIDRKPCYSFNFMAKIGNGYSYKFMEVEQTTFNIYPVRITLFDKHPQLLPEASDAPKFDAALQDVLSKSFTIWLIQNLLAQVDLYNESRAD